MISSNVIITTINEKQLSRKPGVKYAPFQVLR